MNDDVITTRCIEAVQQKATELGVALSGKIWIKVTGKGKNTYEVHAGKPKLGVLTHDQFIRADVCELFLLHRMISLTVVSPADIEPVEGVVAPPNPQTLAYQVITGERHQNHLREKAAKKYAKTKSEVDLANSVFSLSGGTASAAGNVVHTGYKRWVDGEIGYPSWSGPNSTIPLRKDGLSFVEETYQDESGESYERIVCSMRILADKNPLTGERQPKTVCYVRVHGDSDHTTIRRILRGEFEIGDGRLIWDNQKSKWRIALSYSVSRQPPKGRGDGYLAVRRSVRDVLFVMNNEGQSFSDCKGVGLKMLNLRMQFSRRKSECKKTLNLQGDGARGHGKKRFFRPYGKLQDKEARTFNTLLKQLASAIRKAAEASQARVVFVEDFSLPWNPTGGGDDKFIRLLKRMPWAAAETILGHELEEHGIEMRKLAQAHNVTICPSCGSETNVIVADDLVDCPSCKLLCPVPLIAAWNLLKAGNVDMSALVSVKVKASHIARALRQKKFKYVKTHLEEEENPPHAD